MVSPYEADSQLAYLYHNKQIDFIISEDSDMIAYGCFRIIKAIKMSGTCEVLDGVSRKEAKEGRTYFDYFLKLSELIRTR